MVALLLVSCGFSYYEPYFRMAEGFYSSGDYTQAIAFYLKALNENDRRAETYYGLGMAYYQHGDLEEALFAFEKAIEKNHQFVYAYERLANVNLDVGNPDTAISLCRKAIELDSKNDPPSFIRAYNTLGHAYFESGNLDSAEQVFIHVLKFTTNELRRGRVTDHSADKSDIYTDENSEACNGLGEVYNERGSYTHALQFLGSAIALTPEWATPWYNKAKSYEGLHSYMAAEVSYRRAIDLAPTKIGAYRDLAQMYLKTNRESDAIDVYRQALRVDPSDVTSCSILAQIYEKRRDYARAGQMYQKALKSSSDESRQYYFKGRIDLLNSDYSHAIEDFQDAVSIDSGYAEAFNALGEGYRAMRMTGEAQTAFEEAAAADTLFTLPLKNLGSLLLARGNVPEGLLYYRRAARLGDVEAMNLLRARGLSWDGR